MRKIIVLSCILCHSLAFGWYPNAEMLYSFTVFRDGDSTPSKEDLRYSTDPEELANRAERYGYNHLVEFGMRRSNLIGQFLRIYHEDLVGKVYNESNVYLRSIDFDRHKMTMLTALEGMYPAVRKWDTGINWTPVPYTTVPKEDDFIVPLDKCPVLQKAFKERREAFYPEMLEHKDIMDLVTKETGVGFNVTEKPLYIIDITYILQAQITLGVTLPAEVYKRYLKIHHAAASALKILYDGNKYQPYVAGVLFNEFFKDADNIAAGKEVSQRMKVYATEPDVLYSLRGMVENSNISGSVQYSQAYTIDLMRDNATGKIFVVPVTSVALPLNSHGAGLILHALIDMSWCAEDAEGEGEEKLCYYDKFVKLTRKHAWDYDMWKAKCHADVDE